MTSRLMLATDVEFTEHMQVLTLDARRATQAVRVSSPVPAPVQDLQSSIDGTSVDDLGGFSMGTGVAPSMGRILLPPTPQPEYGRLRSERPTPRTQPCRTASRSTPSSSRGSSSSRRRDRACAR